MGYVVYALAAVLVLLGTAWGYGTWLPRERQGSAAAICGSTPEVLHRTLTDVEGQTDWRSKVKLVEVLPDGSWIETQTSGETIRFEWMEIGQSQARMRFSSAAGYKGVWVGSWNAIDPTRTEIQVTETVVIDNPLMRVASRLMFDPEEFAKSYLDELCAAGERQTHAGTMR